MSKPYTQEEHETVLRLIEEGKRIGEIALIMKKPVRGISSHINRCTPGVRTLRHQAEIKASKIASPVHYSRDYLRRIKRMAHEGESWRYICWKLKAPSVMAVRSLLQRRGHEVGYDVRVREAARARRRQEWRDWRDRVVADRLARLAIERAEAARRADAAERGGLPGARRSLS